MISDFQFDFEGDLDSSDLAVFFFFFFLATGELSDDLLWWPIEVQKGEVSFANFSFCVYPCFWTVFSIQGSRASGASSSRIGSILKFFTCI